MTLLLFRVPRLHTKLARSIRHADMRGKPEEFVLSYR